MSEQTQDQQQNQDKALSATGTCRAGRPYWPGSDEPAGKTQCAGSRHA